MNNKEKKTVKNSKTEIYLTSWHIEQGNISVLRLLHDKIERCPFQYSQRVLAQIVPRMVNLHNWSNVEGSSSQGMNL